MRTNLGSQPKNTSIREQRKRPSSPAAPVQCPTSQPFYQLPSSTKRSSTNILRGPAFSTSNNIQFPSIRNTSSYQSNASLPSKHVSLGSPSAAGEPVGWTGSGGKTGPRPTTSSRGSPGSVPRSARASIQSVLPISSRKKKTRRGKRPSDMYRNCLNKPDKTWSILHTNIRGISSKKDSMVTVIISVQPSCITINETGLRGNS